MKRIILILSFTIVLAGCSQSFEGTYIPADGNESAKEINVEKLYFSPPSKMIAYYGESTEDIEEIEKSIEKSKSLGSAGEELVKVLEDSKETFKAREHVYNYEVKGDELHLYNELMMLNTVFDIKKDKIVGRKGYNFEGVYIKK